MEGKAITLEPTRYYLLWACHAVTRNNWSQEQPQPEAAPGTSTLQHEDFGEREWEWSSCSLLPAGCCRTPLPRSSSCQPWRTGMAWAWAGAAPGAPQAHLRQPAALRSWRQGSVLHTGARWGLRTIFKRTSRNESLFLLQLHIFKQENESVLFQPSRFLYRNLANVWEFLGERCCPLCTSCMHMGEIHGKPWWALWMSPVLLLVLCEVTLCSLLKIINY